MYYLYLLGKWLATKVSRRVCYGLAAFVSIIKLICFPKDRRILTQNLIPVVKDKKRAQRVVRQGIKNFSYYLVDFFRFSTLDRHFIEEYVTIEGKSYLDKLVAQGKKVIILSAHLGNYELGSALIALMGYKLCVLALPHEDKRVNEFFNFQRNLCGVEVAQTGMGVKKCFRALQENKIVALMGDRDFFGQGKKVSMFGRTCVVPRGTAVISLHTGACILPVFLVREKKYNYRLFVLKPIFPYEGEEKKTEDMLIKEYIKVLESFIFRFPEQWYMFERYWRG